MTLVVVERASALPADQLLFLLPGYGDEPDRFVDRLPLVDPDRRWHVAVARPPLMTDVGPAWYTVDSFGPNPEQLAAGVAAVDDSLARLTDRLGLRPEAVALAGFSQGGSLALAALLDPTVRIRPAAVGVMASYLPHRDTNLDLALATDRAVLVAHGADDNRIEPIQGRSAARALERAGAVVTWAEVTGGHRLAAPLLDPLRMWLNELSDSGAVGASTGRPLA